MNDTVKLVRTRKFQAMLSGSRKSIAEGKGLPETEFWKLVEQRHKAKSRKPKK